jgi:hypothetical protein
MTSPFAQIFLALQERITEEVPEIIYIDMDYGQLESRERPEVAFPAVLIDFPDWAFTDLSNLVQQAEGTVVLKLATDPFSSTSNITPDTYKEDALNILELEYRLYKAMEGWRPGTGIGPLGRIRIHSNNRRPGLKVRELTFSCAFQDFSAKRQQTIIAAPPAITTNLEIQLGL